MNYAHLITTMSAKPSPAAKSETKDSYSESPEKRLQDLETSLVLLRKEYELFRRDTEHSIVYVAHMERKSSLAVKELQERIGRYVNILPLRLARSLRRLIKRG